jgi:hypothetical protein
LSNEPSAIVQHYALVRWLMARVEGFPRTRRFVLGDRIIHTALDVLESLAEAAYSRAKREPLHQANLRLQTLRLLVRLAKDERHLSLKQYEYAAREMTEVGRQIGGWAKSAE